jgi:hypothetical protein
MTAPARRLPTRDRYLLPLVVLAVALTMVIGGELAARWWMPEQPNDSCLVDDSFFGKLPRKNCTSRTKVAEGEWTTYRYNECGYRSETSCAPVPPSTIRISVIGASTSWGYRIPTPQTWWHRTSDALSKICDRPVDVQNLGGVYNLNQVARTVQPALQLKPDAVLMIVTPFDLQRLPPGDFDMAWQPEAAPAAPKRELLGKIKDSLEVSRFATFAQHMLYRQPESYLNGFLGSGDRADFLRPPFKGEWQRRLTFADHALAHIAAQVHAQGVPLILAFVPHQAQADILTLHKTYPGVDPYALDRALGAIAARHGILYRDLTASFGNHENAASLYMNVDSHPTAAANSLIADGMVGGLLASSLRDGKCSAGAGKE